MQEHTLRQVNVRRAHGRFTMDGADGVRVEFELSAGRDTVRVVTVEGTAAVLEGMRVPLLWVMAGPDEGAQEIPATLVSGLAHNLYVDDAGETRTIELEPAARLFARDWDTNSEVPADARLRNTDRSEVGEPTDDADGGK